MNQDNSNVAKIVQSEDIYTTKMTSTLQSKTQMPPPKKT